eukprot:1239896-Prymnesium_polylepis.1
MVEHGTYTCFLHAFVQYRKCLQNHIADDMIFGADGCYPRHASYCRTRTGQRATWAAQGDYLLDLSTT